MKRLISLFLALTLVASGTYHARAQYIVFDPAAEDTRIIQLAKDIITSGATLATQVNTYASYLKITILDPLANAMIAFTLLQQQKQTIDLITGSLGGNSLLISNPEQWIKNQGLASVRISVNDLSNQNSSYSGSILSSIINTYRGNNSLKVTLDNLGQSSIPSIVQNNLCKDAQLTAIAKNDVAVDGYASPSDIQRRKQELYDSLCRGDPNGTTAASAQLRSRLEQVNTQRPDIGGADSFLALTVGGDNPYNRAVRAQLALANDVATKEKIAQNNLNQGGGIVSPTTCPPEQKINNPSAYTANEPVNIADALCRTQIFTQSSGALQSSFQVAINAPVQRLTNSFGSGILSTLSTLLSVRNTFGLLSNAFNGNSLSAASSGTGGQYAGDLANNPDAKENIVEPMRNQLTTYSEGLSKLETYNEKLKGEVAKRIERATAVRDCFDSLVARQIISENDPILVTVGNIVFRETTESNNILTSVNQDPAKIQEARTAMSTLKTVLDTATSTSQVYDSYKIFNDKLANRSFPSETAGSIREGQFYEAQGLNQQFDNSQGDVYALGKKCHDIELAYYLSQQQGGGN